MRFMLVVVSLAFVSCSKKSPPIVGEYDGTAKVDVRATHVKKDFDGVHVKIVPKTTYTALKKAEESEDEATITLTGGPFSKPCTVDGMYSVDKTAIVPTHSDSCGLTVDAWSADVELVTAFSLFGQDEVRFHGPCDTTSQPISSVDVEIRAKRKTK